MPKTSLNSNHSYACPPAFDPDKHAIHTYKRQVSLQGSNASSSKPLSLACFSDQLRRFSSSQVDKNALIERNLKVTIPSEKALSGQKNPSRLAKLYDNVIRPFLNKIISVLSVKKNVEQSNENSPLLVDTQTINHSQPSKTETLVSKCNLPLLSQRIVKDIMKRLVDELTETLPKQIGDDFTVIGFSLENEKNILINWSLSIEKSIVNQQQVYDLAQTIDTLKEGVTDWIAVLSETEQNFLKLAVKKLDIYQYILKVCPTLIKRSVMGDGGCQYHAIGIALTENDTIQSLDRVIQTLTKNNLARLIDPVKKAKVSVCNARTVAAMIDALQVLSNTEIDPHSKVTYGQLGALAIPGIVTHLKNYTEQQLREAASRYINNKMEKIGTHEEDIIFKITLESNALEEASTSRSLRLKRRNATKIPMDKVAKKKNKTKSVQVIQAAEPKYQTATRELVSEHVKRIATTKQYGNMSTLDALSRSLPNTVILVATPGKDGDYAITSFNHLVPSQQPGKLVLLSLENEHYTCLLPSRPA